MQKSSSSLATKLLLANTWLLLLLACSTIIINSTPYKTENAVVERMAFRKYIDLFIEYGKDYSKTDFTKEANSIEFYFADINYNKGGAKEGNGSKTVAYCVWDEIPRRIVVGRDFWERSDDTGREIAILHELGHCALDKDHVTTMINERPVSIMYPVLVDEDVYLANKKSYLKELFREDD